MTEIPQTSPKTALVVARAQMPSWLSAALLPAAAVLGIVMLRFWLIEPYRVYAIKGYRGGVPF